MVVVTPNLHMWESDANLQAERARAISNTWQTLSVCLQRQNVAMLAAAGHLIPGLPG